MGARVAMTRLECIALIFLILTVGWGATVILRDAGSTLDARNTQRLEDVRSLGEACALYALEHDGQYPEGIGDTPKFVCQEEASSCEGMLDLRPLIPRYLERIPVDPFSVGIDRTFYTVHREGGHIVVVAPYAEGGEVIRVER